MLTKSDKKLVKRFMTLVRRVEKHGDRLALLLEDAVLDGSENASRCDELYGEVHEANDSIGTFIHSGAIELATGLAGYDRCSRRAKKLLK